MAQKKIGYVGLGRMGLRMAKLLLSHFRVIGYDIDQTRLEAAEKIGIKCAKSLKDLALFMDFPRLIWIMVSHGRPVDEVILGLLPYLDKGDVIIDGGNAHYEDSRRRRAFLMEKGIDFVAAGTSGGLIGASKGPAISLDGTKEAYEKVKGLLKALGDNYSFFPDPGKGHLGKIIHNAIEYGMMQSIAEGVALYVRHGFNEKEIKDIFKSWSKGSIIESRLIDCLLAVLQENSILDYVDIEKSETLELVEKVLSKDTHTPVIAEAINMRKNPEQQAPVVLTILALMRNYFGGHEIKRK